MMPPGGHSASISPYPLSIPFYLPAMPWCKYVLVREAALGTPEQDPIHSQAMVKSLTALREILWPPYLPF